MKILGLGLEHGTGRRLLGDQPVRQFGESLLEQLRRDRPGLHRQVSLWRQSFSPPEAQRRPTVDLGDPKAAGWTYMVHPDDPRRDDLIRILTPLAQARGMADPSSPLDFPTGGPDTWLDWATDHFNALVLRPKPHYVLLAAGPERIPFDFQAFLGTADAAVGRLPFDSLDDLESYVSKVLRLEDAPAPAPRRRGLVFATDGGPKDPTYFSHHYMALPIRDRLRDRKVPTRLLAESDASKSQLLAAVDDDRPALVYAACHGLGLDAQEPEQARLQGALCCQGYEQDPRDGRLFSAADVPPDDPFVEGGLWIQFACFGAGTPATSDFAHWTDEAPDSQLADRDFIAALPQRLLAHPRGPVGFIGHVDLAWLHGFDDPDAPFLLEDYHPRLSPFVTAVQEVVAAQPAGLAMAELSQRYSITNAQLSGTYDRLQSGALQASDTLAQRLAETFLFRSDAQNYILLGDPGARVRWPT